MENLIIEEGKRPTVAKEENVEKQLAIAKDKQPVAAVKEERITQEAGEAKKDQSREYPKREKIERKTSEVAQMEASLPNRTPPRDAAASSHWKDYPKVLLGATNRALASFSVHGKENDIRTAILKILRGDKILGQVNKEYTGRLAPTTLHRYYHRAREQVIKVLGLERLDPHVEAVISADSTFEQLEAIGKKNPPAVTLVTPTSGSPSVFKTPRMPVPRAKLSATLSNQRSSSGVSSFMSNAADGLPGSRTPIYSTSRKRSQPSRSMDNLDRPSIPKSSDKATQRSKVFTRSMLLAALSKVNPGYRPSLEYTGDGDTVGKKRPRFSGSRDQLRSLVLNWLTGRYENSQALVDAVSGLVEIRSKLRECDIPFDTLYQAYNYCDVKLNLRGSVLSQQSSDKKIKVEKNSAQEGHAEKDPVQEDEVVKNSPRGDKPEKNTAQEEDKIVETTAQRDAEEEGVADDTLVR